MAEELILFFLRKLSEQLNEEGELLSGVHEDIEWIKNELQAMVAFLRDVHRTQQRDKRVGRWAEEVRKLVYDAEDIIDEFLIRMENPRWNFIKHLQTRHQVGSQIQKVKKRVMEVKERRDRYNWLHIAQENTPGIMRASSTGFGAATPFFQVDDIVGIEVHVEQLVELLIEGKSDRRQVISVFGMGGLGKTTLAKEVYKRVKTDFDCYSWVFLSQSCNLRDVLQRILFGLKESKNEPAMEVMDVMNEGLLQEMIYNYLQDKMYLIVFDDVWDTEIWEELKHALPRERGQIILTTRIQDIASSVEDGCYIYHLHPLTHELAWKLFCKKAFRRMKACPEDLRGLAESIVNRCGGLPLAIVAIAGLLSSKGTNARDWQHVLDTLDWELNHDRDLDRLHKTLLLSYNHLPFYLKYCFLHIGLFPADYEIGRKRLIRMWVAEGFVEKSRNVVKACRVHDQMRDVAAYMLKQEMFGAALEAGDKEMEGRPRRLSIYDNAKNLPSNMGNLKLRSFLMFKITELSSSNLLKIFEELKLVRVLDLQGVPIEDCQTLDIRNTNLTSLPTGINRLQQLRHLHIASFCDREKGFLKMPKGKKWLKNLQTLSGVEPDEDLLKELRSLTNLRKLYIGGMNKTNSEELWVSLGEMKSLRSFTMVADSSPERPKSGGFPKLTLLRILGMENWRRWMPIEEGTMPNLRYLLIADCPRLLGLPEGFHHLTALQDLTLIRMSSYLSYKLQGTDHWKVHHIPEETPSFLHDLGFIACCFVWFNDTAYPRGVHHANVTWMIHISGSGADEHIELFMWLRALTAQAQQRNYQAFHATGKFEETLKASLIVLVSKRGGRELGFQILSIWDNNTLDDHLVIQCPLVCEVRWMPIEEGTMANLQYLAIADCPKLWWLPKDFHHLTALHSLTPSGIVPLLLIQFTGD
ncbi:Disease resistance protein RPH8A [Vitis vinifera]|uniref:Disease resistance protein RPH8A n=1 Tax=Vitis vinifera TaxID=29760 RepID=A0A438EDY3_VITVI|nr:Disease resistance protein RPH8A [Vitis vinifera]